MRLAPLPPRVPMNTFFFQEILAYMLTLYATIKLSMMKQYYEATRVSTQYTCFEDV